MIFSIDIGLDQELDENSSRVYDVVQIFGIPLSDRSIKIVDKIEVDIKPGDIVYITGESGAGKSLLLNELIKHIANYKGIFGKITLEKDIHIEDNEVLIESIGDNTEDAIRLLSTVGLNDAYLFIKRYKELSEGQKYRYRIAKVISSNHDTRRVVVFDEFCSLLDRDTARVVAYMLAKICKTRGYTLLVATAHDDLVYDLNPNVIIHKYYGSRTDVIYNNNSTHECSLLKKLRIEEGSINDWYSLEEFHYRSGKPFGIKYIFRAVIDNITAGVIIYSMPPLSCKGRNIALGRVVSPDEVNRDFITISRVVVSPRFRGIGIATMLVRDTIQRVGKRYVESIAIMGRYNPFFVKAGMREVVYEPDGKYTKVMDKLKHYGFNRLLAADKDVCYEILQSMGDDDIDRIREIVCNVRFAVKNAVGRSTEYSSNVLYDKHILAKTIANIALLAEKKYYYIWENKLID
jgi:ABC-type lipoprotein export system ATPase subunit/GNAT superfamily N-acetyltransferase